MSEITIKGNTIHTSGELPKVGDKAIDFSLTKTDLSPVTLEDFSGKKLILNVFPSVDTGVCATSVREFNKAAAELDNTTVLCVSRDLPFAQARFCAAEGIENVVSASDFATGQFGKDYGLLIETGGMSGLHSRAVVVLDETGKVIYNQQVPEIADEPDYLEALKAVL